MNIFKMAIVTLALLALNQAHALDDDFFYQIGGGLPVSGAVSNRDTSLSWNAGLEWNTDMSCGNFDFSLSVKNQLNGLKGSFQDLMGNVINSATGAVASLPAMIIQRANPALYDLLQNGVLQASEEFHLAEMSCEDMSARMADLVEGNGWEDISKGRFWADESSRRGTEILDVVEDVDTKGLDKGIVWVGDREKGGKSQPPILLHEDAVKAGYNLLLKRAARTTTSMSTSCAGASLCETWSSPQAHADWVTDVLGEQEIRTCDGCQKTVSRAGQGLLHKYDEEKEVIATDLADIVNSGNAPSSSDLAKISGGSGVLITRRVIEAIREEGDKDMIIERLSGELAMGRIVEKALMVRRTLLAGKREANIASVSIAQEGLSSAVDEINSEIQSLVFEMQIRDRIARTTTLALLARERVRRISPVMENQAKGTFKNGAVEN